MQHRRDGLYQLDIHLGKKCVFAPILDHTANSISDVLHKWENNKLLENMGECLHYL